MMTIREYKRAESLEEAWQLNQKKPNRVLGGMIWLKMETINVGTAIDLSGLGLDTIEETEDGFSIGAMVTLRQLEEHPGLAADRLLPQLEISVCASEVLDLDAEHKAVLRLLAGHGKMHLFKITCGIHSGSPSCGRGVMCRCAAFRWL